MINNKILYALGMLFSCVFFLSSLVSAAGVAFQYGAVDSSQGPLSMQPGESKELQMILQNNAGDKEDMTLRASVSKGADMVTITDSNKDYLVPFGTTDLPVNLKIVAPKGARPGDKFSVTISLVSISSSEKGKFSLGSAFDKSFDIVIPQPSQAAPIAPKKESSTNLYLILGILIVAIVLIIFYLKSVKSKKKN